MAHFLQLQLLVHNFANNIVSLLEKVDPAIESFHFLFVQTAVVGNAVFRVEGRLAQSLHMDVNTNPLKPKL